MRNALGILGSALALGSLLVLGQARADAPIRLEKGLNGVRIMSGYQDVLKLYGQPRLILRADEKIVYDRATTPEGEPTGGIKGVGYTGSNGGGGGGSMPGPGVGAPGSGGGLGMMGAPGGGAKGGGGLGMMGAPGGGSGGGGDENKTFADAAHPTVAYIWVYHNPVKELALIFCFNINGRLVLTGELGKGNGGATQLGLKLGDPIQRLYEKYGWPDNIREEGDGFSLDYSTKYHMHVGVLKNKIAGIDVTLFENLGINFFPADNNGGGGGMGGPGLGTPGGGSRGSRGGGGGGAMGAGF
jgi:hypothetical protein